MSAPETYLITPRRFELDGFADQLAKVLDAVPIACVRLDMDEQDSNEIASAAGRLHPICNERDVPLVLAHHFRLASKLKLDGVHLNGTADLREARETLPKAAIVGAHCGTSRHLGMTAAEMGADYVSFGPVSASDLGSGAIADPELFAWWMQMIEVPVVAEGLITPVAAAALHGTVDFLALGDELWSSEEPVSALESLSGATG